MFRKLYPVFFFLFVLSRPAFSQQVSSVNQSDTLNTNQCRPLSDCSIHQKVFNNQQNSICPTEECELTLDTKELVILLLKSKEAKECFDIALESYEEKFVLNSIWKSEVQDLQNHLTLTKYRFEFDIINKVLTNETSVNIPTETSLTISIIYNLITNTSKVSCAALK